eukprot:1629170-Rhodomonas_salina.3
MVLRAMLPRSPYHDLQNQLGACQSRISPHGVTHVIMASALCDKESFMRRKCYPRHTVSLSMLSCAWSHHHTRIMSAAHIKAGVQRNTHQSASRYDPVKALDEVSDRERTDVSYGSTENA